MQVIYNEFCSKDIYLRFADNRVRLSRAFYHVLVLEGAEVAAATMCDTRQGPHIVQFASVPPRILTETMYITLTLIDTPRKCWQRWRLRSANTWTTRVRLRIDTKPSIEIRLCNVYYTRSYTIVYEIVYEIQANIVYDIVHQYAIS